MRSGARRRGCGRPPRDRTRTAPRRSIASDATWKAASTDRRASTTTTSARPTTPVATCLGWKEAGFDDHAWTAARVVDGPDGRPARRDARADSRRRDHGSPARATSRSQACRLRHRAEPHRLGRDGGRGAARHGDRDLLHARSSADDGTASTAGNDLVYGQLQTDYYVARGGGRETWTPRFSYKGFQYVQLSGPNRPPLPRGRHRVRHQRARRCARAWRATRRFDVSQPTLARIHRNTPWAIQSNLHGIITDTPVYEKNGWTGDAQLTARHRVAALRYRAALSKDVPGHGRRADGRRRGAAAQPKQPELRLRRQAVVQAGGLLRRDAGVGRVLVRAAVGELPAPWRRPRAGADVPADAEVPRRWVPRWTGEGRRRYALHAHLRPRRLAAAGGRADHQRARLLGVSTRGWPQIAADTARALGTTAEAGRSTDALFAHVRTISTRGSSRRRRLPREARGRVRPDRAGAAARLRSRARRRARRSGRAAGRRHHEPARRPRVRRRHRRGYVLPVLTATGHHDVAVTVATKTDEPSWGYWTDTLKLHRARRELAGRHAVAEPPFLRRDRAVDLRGPRRDPSAPAGVRRRSSHRPEIRSSGLDRCVRIVRERARPRCERMAPHGRRLALDISVPANARGRVYVPAAEGDVVRETGTGAASPPRERPASRWPAARTGRIVYEVGSGRYEFRVERGR